MWCPLFLHMDNTNVNPSKNTGNHWLSCGKGLLSCGKYFLQNESPFKAYGQPKD